MPNTLQEFLATATFKAAVDLETALARLPEEKRSWSAGGGARSALNMIAECAILNGSTVDMIHQRAFPADFDMVAYTQSKEQLTHDPEGAHALLQENTARVIEAIRAVPNDALDAEVPMPWGTMTLAQVMAYPYWNMTYHEGQINFIASMLGCLT